MRYETKLLCLILVVGWLVGCGAYRPPDNELATSPKEFETKVMYKNLGLKIYVYVRDVREERVNGLLIGKIMLENKRSGDTRVEIKAKWLDKDGYEINDSFGMRPVFLKRNEVKSEQFVAPDPNAVTVRFIIETATEMEPTM